MPLEDQASSASLSRRRALAGVAALVALGLLVAALVYRGADGAAGPVESPPSSIAEAPSTTSHPIRAELTSRLREILKVRDRAFRTRDTGLLEEVYTVDCPCLEAIRTPSRS